MINQQHYHHRSPTMVVTFISARSFQLRWKNDFSLSFWLQLALLCFYVQTFNKRFYFSLISPCVYAFVIAWHHEQNLRYFVVVNYGLWNRWMWNNVQVVTKGLKNMQWMEWRMEWEMMMENFIWIMLEFGIFKFFIILRNSRRILMVDRFSGWGNFLNGKFSNEIF